MTLGLQIKEVLNPLQDPQGLLLFLIIFCNEVLKCVNSLASTMFVTDDCPPIVAASGHLERSQCNLSVLHLCRLSLSSYPRYARPLCDCIQTHANVRCVAGVYQHDLHIFWRMARPETAERTHIRGYRYACAHVHRPSAANRASAI